MLDTQEMQGAESSVAEQHRGPHTFSLAEKREGGVVICPVTALALASNMDEPLIDFQSAIDVPLVIQDFNPGGPTVSLDFIASLHRAHPHFRYLKLEEPKHMLLLNRKILEALDRLNLPRDPRAFRAIGHTEIREIPVTCIAF